MWHMKPHRITLYKDESGKWRWRRQAGNRKIVAASEQGFKRRKYAEKDAISELPADVSYELVILP